MVKIDAEEEDYLYTKTSQIANAGIGLYTAIKIYKYEIIAIYKGKVLTQTEADFLVKNNQNQYFIVLLNGKILDVNLTNSFAKYANDATNQLVLKNNAIITVNSQNQVCLVATKTIQINQEIFCSYGKHYWKNTANAKK